MIMAIAFGLLPWEPSVRPFLGIYKMAELIVQIFVGPFAGALADRFDRRKILLLTDLLSATMCLVVALLGEKQLMVYGL